MQFDESTWSFSDGIDISIPVPRRAVPCKLRVWRVPTVYRETGYFVALQAPGEPEEVPACDLSACELVLEQDIPPHSDALLDEIKAAKKRRIEAERDAEAFAPCQALGRTWDADARSRELLAAAITLAQAGGPLPAVWRDAENNNMPVTSLADLLAIAGAIAQQTQAAYARSWQRKAAVDAAKTAEEVEAA